MLKEFKSLTSSPNTISKGLCYDHLFYFFWKNCYDHLWFDNNIKSKINSLRNAYPLNTNIYTKRNANNTYFSTHVKIYMSPIKFIWITHDLIWPIWVLINKKKVLKYMLLTFLLYKNNCFKYQFTVDQPSN